jgi:uncharacterized protein
MRAIKVAVVGSGISGLAVCHTLQGQADITLFEANDYFGGHTHTVDVTLPVAGKPTTHGVDTGFLVYNERTYPNLINLLEQLGVQTAKSDMSFSVQAAQDGLEWSGSSLATVFAQKSNLFKPRFWRMLLDILRFNRICTRIATLNEELALQQPLREFLIANNFSKEFRDWYFLPMIGCIWSCPTDQMLEFPVATMIRFCHNHGLLQVSDRPQWYTVAGGAKHYVKKIVDALPDARISTPVKTITRDEFGVRVVSEGKAERFDAVVLATHTDQALKLLQQPSPQERRMLGAIAYQNNRAVLHTDVSVLPKRRSAWAAWNYERSASASQESAQVCLHYLLNKLQPLPFEQPVIVSLNPNQAIAPEHVLGSYDYAHPVFDRAAIEAQRQLSALQGQHHTYFCGAWAGYGFHEDGLKSGLAVARELLKRMQEQPKTTVAAKSANDSRPAPLLEGT